MLEKHEGELVIQFTYSNIYITMEACRNPVPPFSVCSATSATDWMRWKRDLELYFVAENITDNKIRKANLLSYGGREVIDLFDLLYIPALAEGENQFT